MMSILFQYNDQYKKSTVDIHFAWVNPCVHIYIPNMKYFPDWRSLYGHLSIHLCAVAYRDGISCISLYDPNVHIA